MKKVGVKVKVTPALILDESDARGALLYSSEVHLLEDWAETSEKVRV